MNLAIDRLLTKEKNLNHQYNDKVTAFLTNRRHNDNVIFKTNLAIVLANIYAIQEQIYALQHCSEDEKLQIDFINDLSELNMSNDQIEKLMLNDAKETFLQNYKIDNELLSNEIDKHAYKFIKMLTQFLDKRKVYRSKPNAALLEELTLLKANIIKQFCTVEKLSVIGTSK
ncbi:pkip-1 [Malacosoma neustria nucleopolyhedrovirus]|uniref:pkip-1 n=1 Tax=Malacosoma neustria nuclear polyhedrosis virus TaxID=38012 RepID=UPI000E35DE9A|nr:pkip-1 [Malacosoma neustria nucleopolyhedrovirus]AUF81644.1 pkip-1 [Malacosoma neustria nucleopolyhedrovirus]